MIDSYVDVDQSAVTPGRNYKLTNSVNKKFMSIRGARSKPAHSLERAIGMHTVQGSRQENRSKLSLQYNNTSIPYM